MIDERLERELERVARAAAPDVGALVDEVLRRRARRATVRRLQAGAVALMVTAAAFGAFVVVQARTTATTAPGGSPSSVVPQAAPPLRLGFPTCDVTSVPVTVDGTQGFAYVATKTGDGGPCPKDGDTVVAVDVNGDGRADASAGPFGDCYLGCEAFAAPDVNGDGTSEVAVSNQGADGYGVSLFAVTGGADPSIQPISVEDPRGIGYLHVDPQAYDPMQFAWVDVVGRFVGARCGTLPDGSRTLIVSDGDKLGENAAVRSTTLVLRGTTATVVDATHTTMPLADAPVPTDELCGAPLFGSAANFPAAASSPTETPDQPGG